MTEQEFMQEQARLRTIKFNEALSENDRAEANTALKALVKCYEVEHPPITGTFYYTEDDVKEAEKHGF